MAATRRCWLTHSRQRGTYGWISSGDPGYAQHHVRSAPVYVPPVGDGSPPGGFARLGSHPSRIAPAGGVSITLPDTPRRRFDHVYVYSHAYV
jgi:hypothetical protein